MNYPQFPLNPLAVSIALALTAPLAASAQDTPFSTNSSTTITAPVNVVPGAGMITTNNQGNVTQVTGQVSGTGMLEKDGAGTLVLTATNNTYTGGTEVHQGTVAVTGNGSLGAAGTSVTIDDGATLKTNANVTLDAGRNVFLNGSAQVDSSSNSSVIAGTIQDGTSAGTLVKKGTGSLTLQGNNQYTGGTKVSAGTLIVTSDANLGAAGAGLTLSGGVLQTNDDMTISRDVTVGSASGGAFNTAGNDVVLDGAINSLGTEIPLVKLGAGKLTLTKDSSYDGSTNIYGGTLSISSVNQIGGDISLDGGTLETTADMLLKPSLITVGLAGATFSAAENTHAIYEAPLSHTGTTDGGITKTGAGTVELVSDVSNYTGKTTVKEGTLIARQLESIGKAVGGVELAGGTLKFEKAFSIDNGSSVVLTGGGGTLDTSAIVGVVSAVVSGDGSLGKAGGGVLVLAGNNTYKGSTTVKEGTLQVAAETALGADGALILNGGTLQATGDVTTKTTRDIQVGAANGTVDSTDYTVTFNGKVSGAGQLIKTGSGKLSLTGDNTFQGGVKVRQGIVEVNADAALGSANGQVLLDGATLGITGSTAIGRTINLTDAGGTLDVASGAEATFGGQIVGTGAASSDLLKSGAGILNLSADNSTFAGDITVTGGTLGIDAENNLGAGVLSLDGGNLRTNADLDYTRALVINAAGGGVDTNGHDSEVSGVISGQGQFTKTGAGDLILSATNLYAGGTLIQQGSLSVSATENLGSPGGDVTLNGGDLRLLDNLYLGSNGNRDLILGSAGGGIDTNGFGSLINTVITGDGILVKKGAGTLYLAQTGSNLLTGGITVEGGTLGIDQDGSLGTASAVLTLNGGALSVASNLTLAHQVALGAGNGTIETDGNNVNATGVISGAGALTVANGGVLTLSGVNTYTGGTTVKGGTTLSISADSGLGDAAGSLTLDFGTLRTTASLSSDRDVSLQGHGVFDIAGQTLTLNGLVQGDGGVIQNGGTLVLNGANTLRGETTVNGGTLQVGNDQALGLDSNMLTLNDSVLQAGADVSLRQDIDLGAGASIDSQAFRLALSGVVRGVDGLVKNGAGTLALSFLNTYSGDTTVNAGTLEIINEASLGSTGLLTLNGASLKTTADTTLNTGVDLNGGGTLDIGDGTTTTVDGEVSGTGGLTKAGNGALILTASNTYTGNTFINAGTLGITTSANLGDAGNSVFLNGGSLQTLVDMTLTQDLSITAASGGIDTAGQNTVMSGVISGAGAFIKSGAGSLTLTGDNTFQGGLTVTGGSLVAADDDNLGDAAGGLTLDGGTLQLSDDLQTTRTVSLGAGHGTIDTQTFEGDFSGVISGSGSLTKAGSGNLILGGVNTYTGNTWVDEGTLIVTTNQALGLSNSAVLQAGTTLQSGAAVTLAQGVQLAGDATVDTQGFATGLSGVVSGSGALTKTGSGSLTLSGSNTYTGDTQVNAGQVMVTNNQSLGVNNSAVLQAGTTLQSGAAVTLAQGVQLAGDATVDTQGFATGLSGVVSGSGALTKTGSGSLTLSGSNTYTGDTQVNAGQVVVTNNQSLGVNNNAVLQAGTTLRSGAAVTLAQGVQLAGDATVDTQGFATGLSGVVSGSGALIKTGSATLTLGGTNTYTGTTQVNAGRVIVTNDQSLGQNNSAVLQAGTALQTNAAVTLAQGVQLAGNATVDTQGFNSSLSGVVSGSGALTKTGGGSLTLGSANTYTGITQVSAGRVIVTGNQSLGMGSSAVLQAGTALQTNASVALAQGVQLAGNATVDTQGFNSSLSGVVSGSGALTKAGSGSLTLSGANTYTGTTQVSAGRVVVTNDQSLGVNNNAVLQAGTALQTNASVTLAQGVQLAGDATVDTQGFNSNLTGVVSGGGALTKTGSGSLTLSGVNTYSGNTQVDAGRVIITNGQSLGSGTGSVVLQQGTALQTSGAVQLAKGVQLAGDATIDTLSFNSGLTGVVSGSGSLIKTGSGMLTLSGINTYTGDTIVNGGTVAIAQAANLGDADNMLVLNDAGVVLLAAQSLSKAIDIGGSGVVDTHGFATSLTGTISGDMLVKQGAGTLTLTGTNTYAGGTTVNGGTLAIASDANLGQAGSGLILDGGVLQTLAALTLDRDIALGQANGAINTQANAVTVNGVISGAGVLTKQGTGSLTLTGNNSHGGGTVLSAGTLSVGSKANLGVGALTLQSGTLVTTGSMTLNQAVHLTGTEAMLDTQGNAVVLSGAVDGTGALVKSGSGSLRLSGTNVYSGGTHLMSGTLTVGTDANLGTGDLTVDGGTLSLLSGFASAKTLSKNTAGDMVLQGNGSFGNVMLNGGTLHVDGRLTSPVTVGAAGTLRGSGTIVGDVSVAGRVSPGNSPGVMTIDGDMTMQASGSYTPEIDGAQPGNGAGKYSQLLVSGTFNAGGTLAPQLRNLGAPATNAFTPVLGQRFDVVQAGSVQGTFASYVAPATGLAPSTRLDIAYTPTSVALYVTPMTYASVAGSANARSVAAALDAARAAAGQTPSSGLGQVLQALMPVGQDGINQALTSMSPAAYAESAQSILGLQQYLHSAQTLTDPLAKGGFTLRGLHQDLSVDSDGNGLEVDRKWSGVQVGVDSELYEDVWQVGAMLTKVTDGDITGQGTSVGVSGTDVALVLRKQVNDWRFGAQLNAGSYDVEATRDIRVGNSAFRTAADDVKARTMGAGLDAVYNLGSDLKLTGGLRYNKVRQDEIVESGNTTLQLRTGSIDHDQTLAMLGGSWSHTWQMMGLQVAPSLGLQVEQNLNDDPVSVNALFLGQGVKAAASDTGATLLRGVAGVKFMDGKRVTVGLDVATEQADNLSGTSGRLTLNLAF